MQLSLSLSDWCAHPLHWSERERGREREKEGGRVRDRKRERERVRVRKRERERERDLAGQTSAIALPVCRICISIVQNYIHF
jgi:hypothetical protein